MTSKRLIAACLAAIAALGCGGRDDDENLSTRADDDPARAQQAQAEMKAAADRAREAEARKLKGGTLVENP